MLKPTAGGLDAATLDGLRAIFGERLSTSPALREQHGRGEAWHPARPPDAVAFARTNEEVSAALRLCNEARVPVIPFGVGTSLEGHVAALEGGLCLDLSQMNAILETRPDDLDVTVQAGVTRKQLNAHLRDTGLFFPIDPGADATIGGMAATRASGTNAVRYGTMRENVLSLTVVLADGRIVRTAGRARKSAAGYDLTRLFIGSEGTLGVIVEATVRLYGLPETMSSAICGFPNAGAAVDTVIETIQFGVPVARCELLDENSIRAVNNHSKLGLPIAPHLFLEFHGTAAAVAEQAGIVEEIAKGHGGADFSWSSDAGARARLWQARHDMHYATQAMRPGARIESTDVCVPISQLTRCITQSLEDAAGASFFVTLLGHVGDGNFHMGLVIDPDDPREVAEAHALHERLVRRAIACGGTCTGEHGVGYGKIGFLREEHGEGVEVMRLIKQALDPRGIMNPGKVLPPAP